MSGSLRRARVFEPRLAFGAALVVLTAAAGASGCNAFDEPGSGDDDFPPRSTGGAPSIPGGQVAPIPNLTPPCPAVLPMNGSVCIFPQSCSYATPGGGADCAVTVASCLEGTWFVMGSAPETCRPQPEADAGREDDAGWDEDAGS